jgi:hypothetical protein
MHQGADGLSFPAVLQATQHQGFLYVATGEYWGYDYVRMPSIYWAVIKSTENLCELTRKDHGLIASQDGLALAYPVIAAREGGGALVAFSYSGKGGIAGGKHPAFPGEPHTHRPDRLMHDAAAPTYRKRYPNHVCSQLWCCCLIQTV